MASAAHLASTIVRVCHAVCEALAAGSAPHRFLKILQIDAAAISAKSRVLSVHHGTG
jgi:hypothetical protein